MLLDLDLPAAVATTELPGSEQIPPLQALLALLTPKLLGKRRGKWGRFVIVRVWKTELTSIFALHLVVRRRLLWFL
jgi:hypothetical protein